MQDEDEWEEEEDAREEPDSPVVDRPTIHDLACPDRAGSSAEPRIDLSSATTEAVVQLLLATISRAPPEPRRIAEDVAATLHDLRVREAAHAHRR